ncbi:MAG: oxidoreductase, partial [Actinobacteria bacterium]|nr:oxidoreductase [Actinomycetota bacterium]
MQPLVEIARKTAVRQQLESARLATDEVIAHRALRRHGGDIALESSLRGARASAALMGVDVDLEFLRSGNLRLDHPGRPIAQAALRVAQEVPQIEAIWRRSPVQALARLHVVAAADLADSLGTDRIGRP